MERLSRFVAIKIKKANDSDSHEISIYDNLAVGDAYGTKAHVVELIDHFTIQGPNGSHSCLVFPALGPSIIDVLHLSPSAGIGAEADFDKSTRLSISAARKILLQALMGLDHLHRQNIIHGDFHGGNWLLELQDINRLSDTDIAQYPKKISEPVRRLDGKENTGDPRHLTRNDPLYKWIATGPDLGVRIVDLGSGTYF
jgi:serine/threonine-protein kinase SRPK3